MAMTPPIALDDPQLVTMLGRLTSPEHAEAMLGELQEAKAEADAAWAKAHEEKTQAARDRRDAARDIAKAKEKLAAEYAELAAQKAHAAEYWQVLQKGAAILERWGEQLKAATPGGDA